MTPPPGAVETASSGAQGETTSGGEEGGPPPPSTTSPPPPTTGPTTGQTAGEGGEGGEESEESGAEGPSVGTLVPAQAQGWRYRAAVEPPPPGWQEVGFDDASWPEGQAPLGEEGEVSTALDPSAAPVGVYLRRRFKARPGAQYLMMYLRRGDGAAVYLNGVELVRSNLPAGELGPTTLAEEDLSGNEVLRYLRFVAPAEALQAGENVIAVALRRAAEGEPGLGFDLQVDTFELAEAPGDELRAQWRTRSYGGEYARENVGVAWVETAGGTFVRTLMVWAQARREHLVRWQSSADGDVVDAMTAATRKGHRTSEAVWDLRDAKGQAAPPGAYKLLLEFTEDDSNKGAPPGPRLELAFTLGAGPSLPAAPADPHYRDVVVVAP